MDSWDYMRPDVVERVATALDEEAAKRGKRFADLTHEESVEIIDFVMRHRLTKADADHASRAFERWEAEQGPEEENDG